jgi:hypothetical protein
MPQQHRTTSGTGPDRVPVALFLTRPPAQRRSRLGSDLPDWYGVEPLDLGFLIARYSRPGDLVLDLDEHPTVTSAARHLHRHPATLVTDGDQTTVRPQALGRRELTRPRRLVRRTGTGVGLILLSLPRNGADSLDLHAMTAAMRHWHALLRPGGFLLAALAAHGAKPGASNHRTTVITAARTSGLLYHQHIVVALAPPPEDERRVRADTDSTLAAKLINGRHVPAHVDLVAFAGTATGEEPTHA